MALMDVVLLSIVLKLKDISKLLINLIKSYKNKFEYSYETKLLIDSILIIQIILVDLIV